MRHHGFTLFELLIVLVVAAILLGIGVPGFSAVLEKTRTKTATYTLLDAINSTRSLAVHRNSRAVLRADDSGWHEGWELFIDSNHDGQVNENEMVISESGELPGVKIEGNTHVKNYISFVSTGAGRKAGSGTGGAFQVGTIKVCPEQEGEGYALILSVGGRARLKELKSSECAAI